LGHKSNPAEIKEVSDISYACQTLRDFHEVSRAEGPKGQMG